MGVVGFGTSTLWRQEPSQGLEADMSRDIDITRLFDLADQKQFAVSRTSLSADVRLIDVEGKLATPRSGAAGFTLSEAIRFLESQPDGRALATG